MAFELAEVFHTETMIKILQSQGHVQMALKLCKKVLEKDPGNLKLRELMGQLRPSVFVTEIQVASSDLSDEVSIPLEVETLPRVDTEIPPQVSPETEDETTESGLELSKLQSVPETFLSETVVSEDSLLVSIKRQSKIEKLKFLLSKIQARF